MSPVKKVWTDTELVEVLLADPKNIYATIGFLDRYLARLKELANTIVDLSKKGDEAIKVGVARAFTALRNRPEQTSLFEWVWAHVEVQAARMASRPV